MLAVNRKNSKNSEIIDIDAEFGEKGKKKTQSKRETQRERNIECRTVYWASLLAVNSPRPEKGEGKGGFKKKRKKNPASNPEKNKKTQPGESKKSKAKVLNATHAKQPKEKKKRSPFCNNHPFQQKPAYHPIQQKPRPFFFLFLFSGKQRQALSPGQEIFEKIVHSVGRRRRDIRLLTPAFGT